MAQDSNNVTHIVQLATALNARRSLALQSVETLMEGLKTGDAGTIEMALRALGVDEKADFYTSVVDMSRSLHTVIEEFRKSIDGAATSPGEARLQNASKKLERVIKMSFDAADKTLTNTERVADLIQAQEIATEVFRNTISDPNMTAEQKLPPIEQFLSKQSTCLQTIREINHEVLMAQAFQDLTGQVLQKVITLISQLETKISSLANLFGEEIVSPDESGLVTEEDYDQVSADRIISAALKVE